MEPLDHVFAVFKGSELEGLGIQDCTVDRTVGPSSTRAFAIAVFCQTGWAWLKYTHM